MSEIIETPINIIVDKIQVIGIQIATYPADQQHVIVTYATGYDDANGKFIGVEQKQTSIAGQNLMDVLIKHPNLYNELKEIAYAASGL